MTTTIGEIAGKIWHYLNENGANSVTKVTTDITVDTEISKNDIQRAIGWLLKEDKLQIETKGRTETLSLK
jgi:predicted RNA-binding protein (virulence factor B family)